MLLKNITKILTIVFAFLPFFAFAENFPNYYSDDSIVGYSDFDSLPFTATTDSNGYDTIPVITFSGIDDIQSISILGARRGFSAFQTQQRDFTFTIRCLNSFGVTTLPDICTSDVTLDSEGFILNPSTSNRYFTYTSSSPQNTNGYSTIALASDVGASLASAVGAYGSGELGYFTGPPYNNSGSFYQVSGNDFTGSNMSNADSFLDYHAYSLASLTHFTSQDTSAKLYQFSLVDFSAYDNTYFYGLDAPIFSFNYNGSTTTIGGGSTTITFEGFDVTDYAPNACSDDESLISFALCNVFVGLFFPSPDSIDSLGSISDTMSSKVPFIYIYELRDAIDILYTNSGTPVTISTQFSSYGNITILSPSMISNVPFVGLLRTTLMYALWIMFGYGIVLSIRRIFNRDE